MTKDFFWSQIKGKNYSIIPAVDCESHDGQQTAAGMRACLRSFIDEFYKVAGFKPVLYTYTSYADEFLKGQFSDCILWQADYRDYAGTVQGWTKYSMWQYSDKGNVSGIFNKADLDIADSSSAIFMAKQATPKKPTVKKPETAYPGEKYFGTGKNNKYILMLDKALIKAGYSKCYKKGKNGAATQWGSGTRKACQAFQRAQGWRGNGADGMPGPETWRKLGI